MRFRAPGSRKHERTISSATVTFWCMTVLPGGAPTMRPIWSPTVIGISHQPSPQERIPRSRHMRAYSRRLSSAAAGIAASEWLIRYVQSARIGNRSRYARRSSIARNPTARLETADLRALRGGACDTGSGASLGALVPGAERALPHASAVTARRRRAALLPVRPGAPVRGGAGAGRAGGARDRRQRRLEDALQPFRSCAFRPDGARGLLARGVRRRRLPAVPRRDERARDVRRRPLPARHGEGRRPRRLRRLARRRLQLRVQPVVRVERPLAVPARAARELARRANRGRRAHTSLSGL